MSRQASTDVRSTRFSIPMPDGSTISARADAPTHRAGRTPILLLAHGSRNDLDHPLLAFVANHLAATADTTVVRFNFPYAERGGDTPDPAALLETTLKTAFEHARTRIAEPGSVVFVGGKSLGGRVAAEMISRRAEGDGVAAAGLIELGYPLHAPGRTDRPNLRPLRHIDVPSLFCIGTRDPFCNLALFAPVVPTLTHPGELYVVQEGDHSFLLPRSSGLPPEGAYGEIAERIAGFIRDVAG